jgi:hypothetical protein
VASSDLPAGLIDGDLRGSVHLSLIGPGKPSNWTSDWTHLTLWRLENQENRRKPKKRANLRSLANWPKWRRRESNACPLLHNGDTGQGLTSALDELGVSGECGEFSDCHRSAGIDARLWEIIRVWHTLPESLRKEVESMCLQSPS